MQLSTRTGFWMLISLLAMFAAAKVIVYDTLDPDCFWHLRVAGQLHRDGIGPIVDDLSFASSRKPWTPYSWLAELGMKAVWDHGGYRSAIAVTAIAEAAIIVLLALCCLESQVVSVRSGRPEGALLGEDRRVALRGDRYAGEQGALAAVVATAIGAFLILPYLSFRPVTFAFVLLFAIGWILMREQSRAVSAGSSSDESGATRPGSVWVWIVVPLTALLTNIHLFSFFVPAMAMAIGIGEMLRNNRGGAICYAILATATAAACLATPMLPGLIHTIFFYSAQDKMVSGPIIVEMQPFIHGKSGWIALVGLIAILGCIAVRYRRASPGQLIGVAVMTLLMLKLGRFAPMFALAACPALAATIPGLRDRLLGRPMMICVLGCILLAGSARIFFAFPRRTMPLSAWVNRHGPGTPGYPCAAADFLDRAIAPSAGNPAHLINEFSWGGYLAWRLQGKYQVLLDGRTQVYPQSVWQATYLGTDADRRTFLSKVSADAALLPTGGSTFRNALTQLGWRSVYKDDRAEILVSPVVAGLE